MSKIKQFNSFQTSYKKLQESLDTITTKINVEYYHYDFQSEPFLHIEAFVGMVKLEFVEDYDQVISIFTPEATLVFTENNYHTNLSNDAVVFASKNDEETYCTITFI
ncbi:hypothetical protein [Oceanobacillus aidingensis]|uniref:Uncharacterized protein n=1 Tax=Oceanobacillus aidingensis TaxID=645964 RepID=A0ABV9JV82_9BACI